MGKLSTPLCVSIVSYVSYVVKKIEMRLAKVKKVPTKKQGHIR